MKRSKIKTVINIFLASVLIMPIAQALPEDSNLPIQITADSGGYDQQINEGFYDTNVVMVQGTLEIQADHAKFKMINEELDNVIATGKKIKIKYLPEEDKPWVYGEGEILEYFPQKNLLVLKKNARLTQGTDIVEANVIEYNTLDKKVKALSDKNSSDRVFFEIKPKGK